VPNLQQPTHSTTLNSAKRVNNLNWIGIKTAPKGAVLRGKVI